MKVFTSYKSLAPAHTSTLKVKRERRGQPMAAIPQAPPTEVFRDKVVGLEVARGQASASSTHKCICTPADPYARAGVLAKTSCLLDKHSAPRAISCLPDGLF